MGDIVFFNDPVVLKIPWSLHPSLKQSKNKFTEGSQPADCLSNHQGLIGTSEGVALRQQRKTSSYIEDMCRMKCLLANAQTLSILHFRS